MKKNWLVILAGPCGSGKSSVRDALISGCSGYVHIPSCTTRKQREGEIHGVDYCFISVKEFKEKIKNGEMFEYVEFNNHFYGTLLKSYYDALEKGHCLIIVDPIKGASEVRKKFGHRLITIFIDIDNSEIKRRMILRGSNSEKDIKERIEIANEQRKIINNFDYIVENKNGKLEETIRKIDNIIKNHKK